uniref:Cell growth regulator with EF hand domain protein 1 n=1 Tax=Sus scrofa TaxID=9823 RepID=F1SEC5_PIG
MFPLTMRMFVLLLLPLGQAAPKDGTFRLDPDVQLPPLPNPFQPGQEQLRLLQSFLKGLERMDEEPEHMSREQVLLYLFALHDYDQSGQLDGLELLSMLTAALAPGAAGSPTTNPVILVVDEVLETQDLNGDGLMTPAELVNFPGEAPRHAEPTEALEPQDAGGQPLLAKSPSRQEAHEALGPREDAGDRWRPEGSPWSLYRRLGDRQRLKEKPRPWRGVWRAGRSQGHWGGSRRASGGNTGVPEPPTWV